MSKYKKNIAVIDPQYIEGQQSTPPPNINMIEMPDDCMDARATGGILYLDESAGEAGYPTLWLYHPVFAEEGARFVFPFGCYAFTGYNRMAGTNDELYFLIVRDFDGDASTNVLVKSTNEKKPFKEVSFYGVITPK